MVFQYLKHSRAILTRGGYKPNRTGIDSISLFGYQNEYALEKGFPLLTTKKMFTKGIFHELIWFLSGDTNVKYLIDNDVHIWDGNAFQHYLRRHDLEEKLPMYSPEWQKAKNEFVQRIREDAEFATQEGDLGEVYGAQWRHWKTSDGKEIDQISNALENLRKNPNDRRVIITAWNPGEVPHMALPPCHSFFHLNVLDGKLDLQLYQRSCDMFLGVPFNIASYAALTHILASQLNLQPGRFIHTFGDSHFYCGADERGVWYGNNLDALRRIEKSASKKGLQVFQDMRAWVETEAPPETSGKKGQDHVPMVLEQLSRTPKQLPRFEIARKPFDKLTIEDFKISNYDPYHPIKASMAV